MQCLQNLQAWTRFLSLKMAQMMLGYVSFVSVDLLFLHSIQYNIYIYNMYLLFTHSKYLCEMTLASASPEKKTLP